VSYCSELAESSKVVKKILIHPAGNYKKLAAILGIIFSFVLFSIPPSHAESRGSIKVIAKARDGSMQKIELYNASYALLIGVSDYTAGWPDLENIPAEVEMVANSLRDHGFSVKTVMNPDSDELEDSFEEFIDKYGYDSQNRLLFLFSGHGYTRKQGKKGYLVPVDAPDPRIDERGFVRKALSMSQINTWARQIEAKHALFLFDSCFSGTIFKTKALPEHPPHITSLTVKPVRQFITAGSSGEEVPARSVFVPSLIKGLRGEADIDKDNYITGTELGMFLHRKVMSYNSRQTPQYGKIRDPELDEGDFVLVAGGSFIQDRENAEKTARSIGTLRVITIPDKATIWIDDRRQGAAPLELKDLTPGIISVKAEKKGYEARTEKVRIRQGRLADVKLLLDKIVNTGSMRVTSDPDGAKWYLNGVYTGTTPDTLKNLDAGSYAVSLKKEGFNDWQQTFVVRAGREAAAHAELQRREVQIVRVTKSIGNTYAVVVGVSHFNSFDLNLEYAASDAEKFYNFLRSEAGGSLPENHVKLLIDGMVTRAAIIKSLTNFLSRSSKDDTVVIYIATRSLIGSQGRQLYFLTHNSDIDNLRESIFFFNYDLKKIAHDNNYEGRVIIYLDCVPPFTKFVQKLAQKILPNKHGEVEANQQLKSLAVFSASRAGGAVVEGRKWGGGVFTYYLLKGLQGAANANQDEGVTIDELGEYLVRQIRVDTDGVQTPQVSFSVVNPETPVAIVK
jgi:uncharacterized caspase-like protein